MSKLPTVSERIAAARDDTEVLVYVIVSLSFYEIANKGMSAEQLQELVRDIEDYYAAKEQRSQSARV